MITIRLFELLQRRVLVTRSSAQELRAALVREMSGVEPQEFVVDFTGVEAVTPSFVDEMLGVVQEAIEMSNWLLRKLTFLNPPTRLSEKFAAIGRARDVEIIEEDEHTWGITRLPVA